MLRTGAIESGVGAASRLCRRTPKGRPLPILIRKNTSVPKMWQPSLECAAAPSGLGHGTQPFGIIGQRRCLLGWSKKW
jgi:hypothetical protein